MTTAPVLRRSGMAWLRGDRRGLAMMEFALTIPLFLLLGLTGAEITNFITVRMRISQLALQIADNAARIGSGSQLQAKTISELDINDLITGANLQSGELQLLQRGRVIVSSLEPVANPNTTNRYKIAWQRCRGAKTAHNSTYGRSGDTNLAGMGPTGRTAYAPDGGASMFVEIYYEYKPLIRTALAPELNMVEIASMMVRDRRDLTQIYNSEAVTPSTC